MRTVYMYEDDYCMCEILPEACFYYCAEQIKNIKEFSKKQEKSEQGAEQKDFYVIPPPEQSIKDLKIHKDRLAQKLAKISEVYEKVQSSIVEGNKVEGDQDIHAFGGGDKITVFFSSDEKSGIVQRIWAVFTPYSKADQQEAETFFSALEEVGEFLYVDYFTDSLFLLKDANGKKRYLSDLSNWFLKQQKLTEEEFFSSPAVGQQ